MNIIVKNKSGLELRTTPFSGSQMFSEYFFF